MKKLCYQCDKKYIFKVPINNQIFYLCFDCWLYLVKTNQVLEQNEFSTLEQLCFMLKQEMSEKYRIRIINMGEKSFLEKYNMTLGAIIENTVALHNENLLFLDAASFEDKELKKLSQIMLQGFWNYIVKLE
jgi:hypothetical protein